MSTMMAFMTREVRTHYRGVCSFYLKVDMSISTPGFDSVGITSGSQHFELAEDVAGTASIRLKNPGAKFVGMSAMADGGLSPFFTIVEEGKEVDLGGVSNAELFIRLDVSYAADET